jgi:Ca2+:H+ antiporter
VFLGAKAISLVALIAVVLVSVGSWQARFTAPWLGGANPPALTLVLLIAVVVTALRSVEIVAARLGELAGILLTTVVVTGVEAHLITSLMLHGTNNPSLAREAVFSTVMIVSTGVVGLCVLVGTLRHHELTIQTSGTSALLAVLVALCVLTLVLPDYTASTSGPTFSPAQLVFAGSASLLLYASLLFVIVVRHKSDFSNPLISPESGTERKRPSNVRTIGSVLALVASLTAVVFLAESVAKASESLLSLGAFVRPDAIAGAIIAILVLLPEIIHALHAAYEGRLQTSLNIALGSAIATTGLTIPAICLVSFLSGQPVDLGLEARDSVLLLLAFGLSLIGFGAGRTNMLTGLVHLVVFATWILLLFVP